MFPNQKLQKLTVKAFKASNYSEQLPDIFEAMYNPESFSQTYTTTYSKGRGGSYTRSEPKQLKLKLVLDGSGLNQDESISPSSQKTVSARVKSFIDLAYKMNGDIHEPNYLLVEWGGKEDGGLVFSCRLESVTITYTSFDRDGSPLRAELDITLISAQNPKKQALLDKMSSPDLTHVRIVKSGDTLPLLTREIYGTSAYYLRVAQVNRLDNFRDLTPGQKLFFPPLGNQAGEYEQ